MKQILLITFILSLTHISVNSKTLTIRSAAGSVSIDGAGDEDAWTAPAWQDLDQLKGDAGNKNNTAKFKMCYDYHNVYVYAEVWDSKIDTSQSKNVWEKDCIEVFFSMDTATQKTATNGKNGFWQLRKVFGREMTDFTAKGFKAEEQDISGGKSLEWQFAWDSLASGFKDNSRWYEKYFRFEMQNADNDGSGRNSQLFWNSNADDQWNSVVHQGYVVLECFDCMEWEEPEDIHKTQVSSIKIENEFVKFEQKTNYVLINSLGEIVKNGIKSQGFSIVDLKKGLYIVQSDNETLKFIK